MTQFQKDHPQYVEPLLLRKDVTWFVIAGLVSIAGGLSALFLGDSVQLPPANPNE